MKPFLFLRIPGRTDFAAATALRRWVYPGGHLGVMPDRVDSMVVEMQFGDQFTGYVVNRFEWTSVRVDEVSKCSYSDVRIVTTIEDEVPLEFVRMARLSGNVTHTLSGWPCAVSVPSGDGQLLFTTLSARSWLRAHPEGIPRPADTKLF